MYTFRCGNHLSNQPAEKKTGGDNAAKSFVNMYTTEVGGDVAEVVAERRDRALDPHVVRVHAGELVRHQLRQVARVDRQDAGSLRRTWGKEYTFRTRNFHHVIISISITVYEKGDEANREARLSLRQI